MRYPILIAVMLHILCIITLAQAYTSTQKYRYIASTLMSEYGGFTAIVMSGEETGFGAGDECVYDIAIGTSNGLLVLCCSSNLTSKPSTHQIFPTPITHLISRPQALLISTATTTLITHSRNPSVPILTIPSPQQTIHAAFAIDPQTTKYLVALSYVDKIELYLDTQMIMRIGLGQPCSSISFDGNGSYFYYFSGKCRVIVDVATRKEYSRFYQGTDHIYMDPVTMDEYQYMMASVSQDGTVYIWNRANTLYNYPSNSTMAIFSSDSSSLISYSPATSNLTFRTTTFSFPLRHWPIYQQINTDNINSQNKSQARMIGFAERDGTFVYTTSASAFAGGDGPSAGNFVWVYRVDDDDGMGVWGWIGIGVGGFFVVVIGIGVFVVRRKRIKAISQAQADNNYRKFDQTLDDQQSPSQSLKTQTNTISQSNAKNKNRK